MAKRSLLSPVPLVAVALAWLIPGLGHIYLGRVRRGLVILVTLAAMFWGGVAMGGVLTVDPVNERWWFIADVCSGAHGLVGWHRYNQLSLDVNGKIDNDPQFKSQTETLRNQISEKHRQIADLQRARTGDQEREKRFRQELQGYMISQAGIRADYWDKITAADGVALVSPTETVARAYCGIAGLLNLMCIFDVLMLSLMGVSGEQNIPRPAGSGRRDGQPSTPAQEQS